MSTASVTGSTELTAEAVRDRLVKALEADLVGPFDPATGAELLPLPPSRWYLTGFLAPRTAREPDPVDPETDDELAAGDEPQADDAGSVDPAPKRRQQFPASLGLSVFLPPRPAGGADAIEAEVSYADYLPVPVADDGDGGEAARPRTGWRRVPRGPVRVPVPLEPAALAAGLAVPGSDGLSLRGELRETTMAGLPARARVLSLFVVNERAADPGRGEGPGAPGRDRAFVFQVRLVLRAAQGFLPRPNRQGEDARDSDTRILALQFRDTVEWAVGHNTSVIRPEPGPGGVVHALETTQLPRYEVRRVEPAPFDGVATGMRALADCDGPGLVRGLSPLTEIYGAWVAARRRVRLDRAPLAATRDALMDEADRARARIDEGIALLARDAEVRAAFTLANRAMHAAALQADRARGTGRYQGDRQPAWRPFQLAFLLLNLASVADPAHADRTTAELIYFPTGGGKTEAYLGLIAFTLLLRRLRGAGRPDGGRGVAVVLRYTLRLLTLDQLGRAATLVCALEELRRRDPARLGGTRFAVGLWVGRSASANRLQDVHAALNDFTPGQRESPFPLSACPWCGADIRIRNIKLVDDAGRPSRTRFRRAVVYCEGDRCRYTERAREGEGLPVLFVDEQIYQEVPDFLVATVDKFAMMPWRGEAGMLFGRATHLDARRAYGVMHQPPAAATPLPGGLRPPELVVQDELHLISGPLGTMVGLYETAVDFLSTREVDGGRQVPKVVCATATVRRARAQIQALFARELAIFPPRGPDDGDNGFATVDHTRPGRLYLGVAAPGRSLRAVSVRAYAVLLAAAWRHADPDGPPDQPADPYLTLVGYFNALRELGGMRRLVEDEVRTRVAAFTRKRPLDHPPPDRGPHPWAADRRLRLPAELTSRESTRNVKETKARLATPRLGAGGDRPDAAAGAEPGPASSAAPRVDPLDTVLASNMISVGLDVDRLGLMVVTGQPKTASEYIQATSRVGRAHPGLVVTCLNVARPRDRSHYERFAAFHESVYREVEATSVTPFSLQTLDRGEAGTLIAMIRHGIDAMTPPRGFMTLHAHRARADAAVEAFVRRGRGHREWHDAGAERRIEDELRARARHFLDAWERIVTRATAGATDRVYSGFDRAASEGKPVMWMATDDRPDDRDERRFVAPTSMRDVEPTSHLWVRFAQLDEGR